MLPALPGLVKVFGSWSLRHRDVVQDVALVGEVLAGAGNEENGFRLWSATTGELVRAIGDDLGRVACLASSADGQVVYAGHKTGLSGFDVATGARVVHIESRARVDAITAT